MRRILPFPRQPIPVANLTEIVDGWMVDPRVRDALERKPPPQAVSGFKLVCEKTGLIDKLRED